MRAVGKINEMVSAGAANERVVIFDWQSYLDTTLLQNAIQRSQLAPQRIIKSTVQDEQTSGVGFALSPASETPVAILPNMANGGSNGTAVILKPGQVYFPGGEFRSFRWGLPYGWLGGGLAQLFVLNEPSADLFWTNDPEICFHRLTLPIYETTSNPAVVYPNWPLRFPWQNAISGAAAVQQGDQPQINVVPSRTILRLRLTNAGLAGMATIRLVLAQTQDLDTTINGVFTDATVTASFIDTSWPIVTSTGFQIGGVAVVDYWPFQTYNADALRIGGDNAQMILIDVNNVLVSGARFMDIERFGKIGG